MTDQQLLDVEDQTLRLRQIARLRAEKEQAEAALVRARGAMATARKNLQGAEASVASLRCQIEDLVRLLCARAESLEPVEPVKPVKPKTKAKKERPPIEAAEDSLGPGYCPDCKQPCRWEGMLHWCERCQSGTLDAEAATPPFPDEPKTIAAESEAPASTSPKAVCWLPETPIEPDSYAKLVDIEEALDQLAAYPPWWGRARDRTAELERIMVEHRLRGIPHSPADRQRIALITAWRLRQDQGDLAPRPGEWWEGAVILGVWEVVGLPCRQEHVEVRYMPDGCGCELDFWGSAVSETGYHSGGRLMMLPGETLAQTIAWDVRTLVELPIKPKPKRQRKSKAAPAPQPEEPNRFDSWTDDMLQSGLRMAQSQHEPEEAEAIRREIRRRSP